MREEADFDPLSELLGGGEPSAEESRESPQEDAAPKQQEPQRKEQRSDGQQKLAESSSLPRGSAAPPDESRQPVQIHAPRIVKKISADEVPFTVSIPNTSTKTDTRGKVRYNILFGLLSCAHSPPPPCMATKHLFAPCRFYVDA